LPSGFSSSPWSNPSNIKSRPAGLAGIEKATAWPRDDAAFAMSSPPPRNNTAPRGPNVLVESGLSGSLCVGGGVECGVQTQKSPRELSPSSKLPTVLAEFGLPGSLCRIAMPSSAASSEVVVAPST
jgi:hypothetical protein